MSKKRTPMLEQYFAIKQKHQDAVLFFHMGDFYEMFGDDAVEVSRILDLTLTARGKGTENEIPMCGVPIHAASSYLAKLTKAGKRVAICDQVTEPNGKDLVQREVTKIVTPGTTFDDANLAQKQSNFLCNIVFNKDEYAFGIVDITTGRFQVGILENESTLLGILSKINPSEIIAHKLQEDLLHKIQNNYYVTSFSPPSWRKPELIITEHFKTIGLENFGLSKSTSLQEVVANIIAYLQETQKSALGHIRTIETYNPSDFMLLDESTIRNLELFFNQQSSQQKGSLIECLDQTTTAMGARLLRWWVMHPLIHASQIQDRQQVVKVFINDATLLNNTVTLLKSLYDLERLVGKIGTLRANPRDLYNLKETIKQIPFLKQLLDAYKQKEPMIAGLLEELFEHSSMIDDIEKVLVDRPPILLQDSGYIKKGFNAELDELNMISSSGKQWLSDLQKKERERTGINSLKVKYNKVFGYYIEISNSNLVSVPDDYIRKQTLVNAERFITPELKEYEEKILGAQDKILQIERELFFQLRQKVYEYVDTLQKTAKALAVVDVLSSFAFLALSRNYACPEIVQENCLQIKQGRHPVIEYIQTEPYIPNDLFINDEQQFLLLTGPNMSGKSSFLRQNALIVLLAQMGSFVPAQFMKWGVVDRIFTRVGASDNLALGRSTFMVEMQEAAYIINNATQNSLIILDELGRGTSTYDGLSLAWAITEYIHDGVKAKTIFATHYHELIEVIEDLVRAKNYSVAVAEEGEDVVFLHQVVEGGVNQSYGVEVAKLAGLPSGLILRAKDILGKLERHAWENDVANRQPSLPLMPVNKLTDHPVIKKLKHIEPDKMTPMQALQLLIELKEEIE